VRRGRESALPRPTLHTGDAIALIVGIVVGAGIFRTPSLVAANSDGAGVLVLAWVLGGLISLVGALCYAELATAFPNAGGDYHFLLRAFGGRLAFLHAWSRIAVVQTGSIALLAFVFGDYAGQLVHLGAHTSAIYAAAAVVALTLVNVAGVKQGKWTQNVLTSTQVLGVLLVVGIGLAAAVPPGPAAAAPAAPGGGAFGLVMIFVLLTYGGWNEAAYLSAEVERPQRTMVRALLGSIAAITTLYLLANLAYLRGLGLAGMAASDAVAADLLRRLVGDAGAGGISVLVAIAALTSANATIFTGGRGVYALGRDFPLLGGLGGWDERRGAPVPALLVQGAVALLLVLFGALARRGFETMVEYTAPVFWLFFLLVGVSLMVLRVREPGAARPFRVPLYPLTPLLFCAAAGYLLYSSLAYTGVGALVGVGVLLAGTLVLAAAGPARAGTDARP
jgi:basic amino acid/polyamine antiporter, APA family